MANELRHSDVGTALAQVEWVSTTGHIFNGTELVQILSSESVIISFKYISSI